MVAVHFLHRWLAVLTVGVAVWAWNGSKRSGPLATRAGWAVLVFAPLQLSLGLATIWLHVPVGLAVWHQVNGACLLLSVTALVFATPMRAVGRREPQPRPAAWRRAARRAPGRGPAYLLVRDFHGGRVFRVTE